MRQSVLKKITAFLVVLFLMMPLMIACGPTTPVDPNPNPGGPVEPDPGPGEPDPDEPDPVDPDPSEPAAPSPKPGTYNPNPGPVVDKVYEYELVVYGDTAAAVAASVAASRQNVKVAMVAPNKRLGGMFASGLSNTDLGTNAVIGGIAREVYTRNAKNKGKTGVDWYPSPKEAEALMNELIDETKKTDYGVDVFRQERLVEKTGVVMTDTAITQINCESGKKFKATQFIDASYEGDLMAQAGVTYTYGREGQDQYGEMLAGVVGPGVIGDNNHQFNYKIKARDEKGKLLYPEVSEEPLAKRGSADKKVQAYNFRMCMTKKEGNKKAFPKPEGYDPARYALLLEHIKEFKKAQNKDPLAGNLFIAGTIGKGSNFDPATGKFDFNNRGAFSTDYIGGSYDYPDSTYEQRDKIYDEHYKYTAGLFYFLANDPNVPVATRNSMNEYGLAADEFTDNQNWPFQLYVREGRRMVGEYVMTQKDIEKYGISLTKEDSIGMGSYASDSHNVQRYITEDGYVRNEGNMEVPVAAYEIPYRSLLPKKSEVNNLLVTCTLSASHVAYSSMRMEPQYMIIGQAAGTAASIALKDETKVHDISVEKLQKILKDGNAVLSYGSAAATDDFDKQEDSVIFYDSFDKYTDGWGISEGSTGATKITQNASSVRIEKSKTNTHGYMTRKAVALPASEFTYGFRAKLNGNSKSEFTVRSPLYLIKVVLTRSANGGTVQNEYSGATKTKAIDTSVWHDYKIVAKKTADGSYVYDAYVDGTLAWADAVSGVTGTNIVKIGSDNIAGGVSNFDLEYFMIETGAKAEKLRAVAGIFRDAGGKKVKSMADASGTLQSTVVLENATNASQNVKVLIEMYRNDELIASDNETAVIEKGTLKEIETSLSVPTDKTGLAIKVTALCGEDHGTQLLPDGIRLQN